MSKADEVPDTEDSRGDDLAEDRVAAGDCVAAPARACVGSSLLGVEAAPRLLHLFVNGWRAVPSTGGDPTSDRPAGEEYARIAVQGGSISSLLYNTCRSSSMYYS